MPRGRRSLHAAAASSATEPPPDLEPSHRIMRVAALAGRNLISVDPTPQPASAKPQRPALVELPARLRGTVWVRRGGFVVVDTAALGDRDNKLIGEIVAVCVGREWRRMPYWPEEWKTVREAQSEDDSDEEGGQQSRAGLMPPSDDESDDEPEDENHGGAAR